jgi:hypothetical protein
MCANSRRAPVRYNPVVQKLRAAAPEVAHPTSDSTTSSRPSSSSETSSTNPTTTAYGTSSTATASTTASKGSAASSSSFQWLSYWYPVHVLDSIDPSRPHAVELLGKQLVLWRSGDAAATATAGPAGSSSTQHWQCFENACPHRCSDSKDLGLEQTLVCIPCRLCPTAGSGAVASCHSASCTVCALS